MSSYLCFSKRQLHKCSTQPQLLQPSPKILTTSTIHSSSSSSIQSDQQEFRKLSIKWILDFQRKLSKDSNHLAVWYFQLVTEAGLMIKQSNWQLIAATTILLATKMNQIYPPSINSIIKRCNLNYLKSYPINANSILSMEEQILKILNFDIARQSPYNLIIQKLEGYGRQIQECEKLLKVIYPFKQICKFCAQNVSNAILYLICRENIYLKKLEVNQMKQVKILSDKIYNLYKKVKSLHEQKKNMEINKYCRNQFKQNYQHNQLRAKMQYKQCVNTFLIKNSDKYHSQKQILKEKSSTGLYSKQSMRLSYKNLYMYV